MTYQFRSVSFTIFLISMGDFRKKSFWKQSRNGYSCLPSVNEAEALLLSLPHCGMLTLEPSFRGWGVSLIMGKGSLTSLLPLCNKDYYQLDENDSYWHMAYLLNKNNYTPRNEVGGGLYWIQRVRLSVRPSSGFSVFRTYFGLNMQIMKWNLVWLFTMMSYRSSLSFVVIDQYLPELWPLDLEFSWKFLFSGHILDYFFGYWNETWCDCLQ